MIQNRNRVLYDSNMTSPACGSDDTVITVVAPPGKLGVMVGDNCVIAKVLPGSALLLLAAHNYSSFVKINDQILEINGTSLNGKSSAECAKIIASMVDQSKTLLVRQETAVAGGGRNNDEVPLLKRKASTTNIHDNNNEKIAKIFAAPLKRDRSQEEKETIAPVYDTSPGQVKVPKLISVRPTRKLSILKAEQLVSKLEPQITTVKSNIREKEKLIRSLQKQLKNTEKQVDKYKTQQRQLESSLLTTSRDTKSDTQKLIDMATANASGSYYSSIQEEKIAKNLTQDVCNLYRVSEEEDDDDERINIEERTKGKDKIFDIVASSGSIPAVKAAIEYLLKSFCSQKPIGFEHDTIIDLYKAFLSKTLLTNGSKKTNKNYRDEVAALYPLIAEAIVQIDGTPPEHTECLIESVIKTAKIMLEEDTASVVTGSSKLPLCPIQDIMYPTLRILHQKTTITGIGSIKTLQKAIEIALIESTSNGNEEDKNGMLVNYAMPEDADVAERAGSKELANFLRSSTLQSFRFNLSKNARMKIHRIIDERIGSGYGYKKLRHASEGFGRARVLVVTKIAFDLRDIMQRAREREQLLGFMQEGNLLT